MKYQKIIVKFISQKEKKMSGVGFEPTPPFGDQNTRYH